MPNCTTLDSIIEDISEAKDRYLLDQKECPYLISGCPFDKAHMDYITTLERRVMDLVGLHVEQEAREENDEKDTPTK